MTVERELDSLNSLLLGLPSVASFIIQAVGGKDLVTSLFKERKKKKKRERWCLIFLNPTGRNNSCVFHFFLWLLTVFAWQKYLNWWSANDAVMWRVFWFSCVQWDVFCCCCFGCLCYSGVSVSPWGEGNIDVLATALWTVKILAFTNMVELLISIIDP